MKRLKSAQKELIALIETYNAKSAKPLKEIDINSSKDLSKALDLMHNRESIAHCKNDKNYPYKLAQELRGKFADILLLLDNFDIKVKKNKSDEDQNQDDEIAA